MQLIIGILDCVPNYTNRPGVIWAQSSLMLVWNFIYDLSIGPVCFVILCECSATRVRSRTIAFATAVQATAGIVMTIAIPYLINPDEANLRGKLGFFFGGLAVLCLCWAWFRVPETRGKLMITPASSDSSVYACGIDGDIFHRTYLRRTRYYVRAQCSNARLRKLRHWQRETRGRSAIWWDCCRSIGDALIANWDKMLLV